MPNPISVVNATNNANVIIQGIDTLKWPVLILIIFFVLRKEIVSLVNRVTKIGLAGTTVEAQQQQKVQGQEKKKISNIERSLGLFREETIELFKGFVFKETDIDNIKNDNDKIEHLLNYSVIIYILKHFGTIYDSIYGSQLLILQQLNSSTSEDMNSLKHFYDKAVEQNPKGYEDYSYESYLNFLTSFNLIVQERDKIKITILGVDFLKFITETNKSFNKAN
jgi:hypothetical protein